MPKLISDRELENLYFSDNNPLKENIDIEILEKKYEDSEKKDKKMKMYKKIIEFQKKEIVKNQHILDKQQKQKKGGNSNNINTTKNIINELCQLNTDINYYDIKRKSLINKILFIGTNIIFTIFLFTLVYNYVYFNHNKTINFGSIILSILLYILYKLVNILEKNICNNNNTIYNLDIYIKNLNKYITSNDLSEEKKMEMLEEIDKYKNIFNEINIINSMNSIMNDLIIYLPFIIFIILYILLNTELIDIFILTIIITLIITPYINIITFYNIKNTNMINSAYLLEKLLIIYISYLIINIIYNKHTLLNIFDLILVIIKKIRN